ncbi:MAG: HAD family hydrolase, partial [Dermatophilaceae bacterium]
LLDAVVTALDTERSQTVFIGDAVTDVRAGRAAGIPVIGLAKHQARRSDLLAAGPHAVIDLGNRAGLIAELTSL